MGTTKYDNLSVTTSDSFFIFTSYLWSTHEDANHDDFSHALRCDGHYLLSYHRDRLVSAAQAFGWSGIVNVLDGVAGLELLSRNVMDHLNTISNMKQARAMRKIKVCIYRDGHTHVESAAIGPKDFENIFMVPVDLTQPASSARFCVVKLDAEFTIASVFTTHKTSQRSVYDRARRTADIVYESPLIAEVLLFNTCNEIMECSLSTPYFFRDRQWVTPPLCSGGHAGVTRRLALEERLCKEEIILVGSLRHGEDMWISNGVRGFIQATLYL